MGIPTYFRYLFQQNNKIVTETSNVCDYLFFDFNSILYKVYYDADENKGNEVVFMDNIIKEVLYLCNQVMKPKTLIYFAMDGCAPRAKMVQQRSRRYKSIQLQTLFGKEGEWSPSNHICPGTKFMSLFCGKLLKKIHQKEFHCRDVILNDVSIPGEGEHKILPIIRKLKVDHPDSHVYIMSPDNDLLSLGVLTMKSKITIVRYMDGMTASLLKTKHDPSKIVYIDLDQVGNDFQKDHDEHDRENLLLDYNFLLSMVGNDFVPALPMMKIKSGGMDKLIGIYHEVFDKKQSYLIEKNTLHINVTVFKAIVQLLAKRENNDFLMLGSILEKEKHSTYVRSDEEDLSEETIYQNNLQHLYLCHQKNPLCEMYREDFEKISFFSSSYEWKFQYYEHFCNVNTENFHVLRNKMVEQYLRSLRFTLLYYNDKCPSWGWFYPFRVSPLFSDIFYYLSRHEHFSFETSIPFQMGKPLLPFEQLLFILPPQSKDNLPKEYHVLFEKYKKYFPYEFRVDALQGLKYIYSEAILPEWDCFFHILSDLRKIHPSLSPADQQRNKNETKIYRYIY